MRSKHISTAILLLALCTVLLTGCHISLPEQLDFLSSSSENSNISYITSTDDVTAALTDAMQHNQSSCTIYMTDSSIIQPDELIDLLPGLTQIECRQRNSGMVISMEITMQYWDNYPIEYAYKMHDTSYLNERQMLLYNTYLEILNRITSPEYTDWQNELAVHDYLVTNITYTDGIPGNQYAYNALIDGTAVCSGYTEAFKTFMDFLGIKNTTVSGTAGSEKHIWNMVCLNESWYHTDVTWDDPVNSTPDYIEHAYFNITDSDMGIDHSWDYSRTPAATQTQYSYKNITQITNITSQSQLDDFLKSCIASRADNVEFTATTSIDIAQSVASANVNLTYFYKNVPRTDYTLYTILFSYTP